MTRATLIATVLIIGFGLGPNISLAADREQLSPQQWMTQFTRVWREAEWNPETRPPAYMRVDNDQGWPARMRALQGLVGGGEQAVPLLLKSLNQGTPPERILAAQALCYLSKHAPSEALLKAVKSDDVAAVRLYAVDALGMQGKPSVPVDWEELRKSEKNKDVRKHIDYVLERKQAALEPEITAALKNWDPQTINTAVVGKPAPEFTLKSATGETVSLGQYRGKKAVVLVFIYGDT